MVRLNMAQGAASDGGGTDEPMVRTDERRRRRTLSSLVRADDAMRHPEQGCAALTRAAIDTP
jgi:hypothetical protein